MLMAEMTQVYLGELMIEEPVTALTDIIAGLTGIFAFGVLKGWRSQKKENRWLSRYFIFIGLGLICAGLLGHAFFYQTGYNWNWKTLGWTGSALGIFCMERGSILSLRTQLHENVVQGLLIFQVIKLLAFFAFIYQPGPESFEFVKANSALGLGGIVLGSQLFLFIRDRREGRTFIIGGILVGVITAIVYNQQITLSKWFNYHDISHLMTALSIFIMYLGVRKLMDPSDEGYSSMGDLASGDKKISQQT